MLENFAQLTPQTAWEPLPPDRWDEAAARHLLLRIGFGAAPAETARALQEGPAATLRRYFTQMPDFPAPAKIAQLAADTPELARSLRGAEGPEKRQARQRMQERSRDALWEMTQQWLQGALRPESAPAEKWLLFLTDVWVVSVAKVRNSALIFQHQDRLRQYALRTGPLLAKAMTRSPAMVLYLDLQESKREAPNENFARELFELFTLGEGHYTEQDIKQAARAFTGYRQQFGRFSFQPRQHDRSRKTVFGQTGNFTGDEVIDLIYRQPAAGAFLPREMARFYLTEAPLPVAYTDALGAAWARVGYDFRRLLLAFFGSRLFYAADFRGNFIKSPLHFYLGLLQDLQLDVTPLPRRMTAYLRQMGQMPFEPPNVRGWVGGRAWINSATLAARRQLVSALVHPLNRNRLNADEVAVLAAAEAEGPRQYTVPEEKLAAWSRLTPAAAAAQLLTCCLPGPREPALATALTAYLAKGRSVHPAALRAALAALLESPDYQLC